MPRATVILVCEDCLGPVRRQVGNESRAADGLVRCLSCSRRNQNRGRTYPSRQTGATVACMQCGAMHYRQRLRLTRTDVQLCSRACADRWRSEHPTPGFIGSADNAGEKNGRYVDGQRVGANVNKRKVREAVIFRDGDQCLLCHRGPPGLHLHRVIYGSQGGKYEVDNCVQLCGADHERVHASKRTWLPRLLEHLTA